MSKSAVSTIPDRWLNTSRTQNIDKYDGEQFHVPYINPYGTKTDDAGQIDFTFIREDFKYM